MLHLLLVRHGEPDWNLTNRFQGHSDIPLNITGHQQAAAIGGRLAKEEIHAIFTSDLSRARDTAKKIAENHACDIIVEPRLREGSFGQWEGLTYAELQQRQPEAVEAWHEDISSFAPPGGETLHQLARRVDQAYNDIAANHQDQTVLLVAHGGSLQMLIANLLELPPKSFWQFNLDHCSLSKISVYDESAIINSLNETNHLTFQRF